MTLSCRFWRKFPILTQRTYGEGRSGEKELVSSHTTIQFIGPTHAESSVMTLNIIPLMADQLLVNLEH